MKKRSSKAKAKKNPSTAAKERAKARKGQKVSWLTPKEQKEFKAKAKRGAAKAKKARAKAAAKATGAAIAISMQKQMKRQQAAVDKKLAAANKKAEAAAKKAAVAEKKAKAAEAKAVEAKAAPKPAPAAGATEKTMKKGKKGNKKPKAKAAKTGKKAKRTAKQRAAAKKNIKKALRAKRAKAAGKAPKKARKAPKKVAKKANKPRKAPKARKTTSKAPKARKAPKGRVYKAKVAKRPARPVDKKTGQPRKRRPLAGTWINTQTGARRKFYPAKRRNPLFSGANVAVGATTVVVGRLIAEGVDRFIATYNSQGDPMIGNFATGSFAMQATWKRLLASGGPTGALLIGGALAAHYNHPAVAMALFGGSLGFGLKFLPQAVIKLLGYTPLKDSGNVLLNRLLPEVATNYQPPPAGGLDYGPRAVAGVGCGGGCGGCSSCRGDGPAPGCMCPKARPGQQIKPPPRVRPVPLPDSGPRPESRNPGVVPGMIPTPDVQPGFPGSNGDRPQGQPAFPQGQPEAIIPTPEIPGTRPGGGGGLTIRKPNVRVFEPRLRDDIRKAKTPVLQAVRRAQPK